MSVRSHPVVSLTVAAGCVLALAQMALAQGSGRVVGTVIDEDGNPMEGVTVTAINPTPRNNVEITEFIVTTERNGKFAMLGLVSSVWTFSAEFEGYHIQEGPQRVTQSTNPEVNFNLTRIRHQLELALGDEALEGLNPEAIEGELTAADSAFNTGNWDAAISGYQSVLAQLPQLSNLHLQIGNAHAQRTEYELAIASFERMLAEDSENEDARAGIARARLGMGDLSAADALEETASGLNASREDLYNLGEIQFAQGAPDVAAQWYEKATMVDPNWEKPLFKLALVALNKGDIPGAKDYFQKVVDVAPDSEEGVQAQATLSALP